MTGARGFKNFNMEAELAKLESDDGAEDIIDPTDEINDWEFDELGRDFDSASNHLRRWNFTRYVFVLYSILYTERKCNSMH